MAKSEYDEEKGKALAEYINNIREARGLGHNQLATLAGLDASVLHKILYGTVKKVNPFHLQSIGKVLKIDYKILYQIVGYLESTNSDITENDYTVVKLEHEIPVYSRTYIGPNGVLEFGEILENLVIPSLRNGTTVIGIKINVDSMEGTIPKGATILIKKNVELNDNDVGFFIYNNVPQIKRLRKNNDDVFLTSDNKNYLPICVKKDDELIIIGKVVEVMYKL